MKKKCLNNKSEPNPLKKKISTRVTDSPHMIQAASFDNVISTNTKPRNLTKQDQNSSSTTSMKTHIKNEIKVENKTFEAFPTVSEVTILRKKKKIRHADVPKMSSSNVNKLSSLPHSVKQEIIPGHNFKEESINNRIILSPYCPQSFVPIIDSSVKSSHIQLSGKN